MQAIFVIMNKYPESFIQIGHRLPNIKKLMEAIDCNVLILSYRGYAKSEGFPNEKGICLDAQAAYSYLKSRTDIDQRLALEVFSSHHFPSPIPSIALSSFDQ